MNFVNNWFIKHDNTIGFSFNCNLFASGNIPSSNEFFDKITLFRMIVRKFGRSTASKMMLKEFTIERLEQSHSCIDLMSDIGTIRVLLDEFCDFFEGSFCLADTGSELGLVWSHVDVTKIY